MHPVLAALDARRDRLEQPPLSNLEGRFHSHVTLRVPAALPADLRATLERLATAHRAKLTVIELADLDRRVERDVMFTRYFVDDQPGAVARIADDLRVTVTGLLEAHVEPIRVKIEHESLPSLEFFDAERYHEVHIKLSIDAEAFDETYAWLEQAGRDVGWRPSRNPYERRNDQVVQFVTLRAYKGDRAAVDARVLHAVTLLEVQGLVPVEIKRETTVLDTRRAHDAWWA
ncbi:MAG: hypothetical protein AAGA48_35665 [Myxococcota bacterium]